MSESQRVRKQRLFSYVHRYIHAGHNLSIGRYTRLMGWLGGDTFAEIAEQEGVTAQAVANSVRRDVKLLETFAKENDKDYHNISKKGTT